MTDSFETKVRSEFGQELLHWASRSDLWQLAYRFAALVNKINEPIRNSPFVDHIFTLEEEDFDPAAMRELRCSYVPPEDDEEPEVIQSDDDDDRYRRRGSGECIYSIASFP